MTIRAITTHRLRVEALRIVVEVGYGQDLASQVRKHAEVNEEDSALGSDGEDIRFLWMPLNGMQGIRHGRWRYAEDEAAPGVLSDACCMSKYDRLTGRRP